VTPANAKLEPKASSLGAESQRLDNNRHQLRDGSDD
jgi:hypothetical protein